MDKLHHTADRDDDKKSNLSLSRTSNSQFSFTNYITPRTIIVLVCLIIIIGLNSQYIFSFFDSTPTSPLFSKSSDAPPPSQPLTGKRVLVTGAAGFIGFHLSNHLHDLGNKVVGLDSFNDYYDPELKRVRANQLTLEKNIRIYDGNVCDEKLLKKLFKKYKFTHVAHLAAQAGVRYSLENPKSYVQNNLMCLVNILEIIRHVNPQIKFIYASSSSVYGRNKKIPFSEAHVVDHPSNIYGASKKANEAFALVYHELFGIAVTGLRFFTVYGPFGRPDMAIYQWANSMVNDQPLRLYEKKDDRGNSIQLKRDFTYVDDIVDGIIRCLTLGADLEVFNLGNNTPEPITRLIDLLSTSLYGSTLKKPKIQLQPLPPADITATYADISHAQKRLGFKPTTRLDDGVARFVQWYRDYYFPKKLIILYAETDDDFIMLQPRLKRLANCHYVVFHPRGSLSPRVINKFTQIHLRFREVKDSHDAVRPSFLTILHAFGAFIEKIQKSTPNTEWKLSRVALLSTTMPQIKFAQHIVEQSTHELSFVLLKEKVGSTEAAARISPNNQCSILLQNIVGKRIVEDGAFGGSTERVLLLLVELEKMVKDGEVTEECVRAKLNAMVHGGAFGNDAEIFLGK